jgi:hypothetical protein
MPPYCANGRISLLDAELRGYLYRVSAPLAEALQHVVLPVCDGDETLEGSPAHPLAVRENLLRKDQTFFRPIALVEPR